MKKLKVDKNTELNERQLADVVAYELLQQEKREKRIIWLFLLIFVLIVFFFSYFVFSKITAFGDTRINYANEGSLLFSYEEGTNAVKITEALPTADSIGKVQSKEGEYFTFRVAVENNSVNQPTITYEISLTPKYDTLDPKYVRIYLLENDKEIKVNNKSVNSFNELTDSKTRNGAKLLYKKSVTGDANNVYTFKMWLRDDYIIDGEAETFSCFVNVDAY